MYRKKREKFIRILVWINLARKLDCRIEKICHQLDSSTQAKYEQVRHKNKCYDFSERILRTLKKSSLIRKIMMTNFKDTFRSQNFTAILNRWFAVTEMMFNNFFILMMRCCLSILINFRTHKDLSIWNKSSHLMKILLIPLSHVSNKM